MEFPGTMKINEKNHLEIGGCDCVELAKTFGTPLFVMDETLIRQNCRSYINSLEKHYQNSEVIYASKAFSSLALYKIIEEEGLGLDVVSGGEIFMALEAGFPPEKIYFHGNNKSYDELKLALESGITKIIVDNFLELDMLNELCREMHKNVIILLRITPGIEAHTHHYIRTGQIDSKFGFPLENGQGFLAVEKVLKIKRFRFAGLHCHIGSQIFDKEPFEHTVSTMMDFIRQIKDRYNTDVKVLNLGGGFGIKYIDTDKPRHVEDYIEAITKKVNFYSKKYNLVPPKIMLEPGRAIVGDACITLYTIGAIKDIPGIRKYVSVDGGMTDNIRPALYQAKYHAMIANNCKAEKKELVSIAGKCCESGDMLIWDIELPKVSPGDYLAVFSTGAYHYSMSSNYNKIPRPAVVLVSEGEADIIIKRETYKDLVKNDVIPKRLKNRSTCLAL